MSKRGIVMWIPGALLLILLFLASSTDLIIKEQEVTVYPISVIVHSASDEFYGNFRRGMDKAAEEFHADVNFITLYNDHSQEQQMELVQREIRDGAKAVILEPVFEGAAVMDLEAMKPGCPVIFLRASSPSDFVADSIRVDGYEAGRELAERALEMSEPDLPFYLFVRDLSCTASSRLYDGVAAVMEENGRELRICEKRFSDAFREAIESTVYPGQEQVGILAIDTESLSEAAQIIEGSTVYQEHVNGLFGVGSTTSVLNQMEKGIIDGILVYNQFDEGYLSVKKAAEAAMGGWQKEETILDTVFLRREDIRRPEYEKMLYPIE